VVTGDAVVLDVRVAQLPVRAVSALIDITVIVIAYLMSLMVWAGTLGRFDDAAASAIMIIFTVLVFVGYPLVLETATRGRTVGKMVMGLRVVSDDGGPERFRQALFRALASVVEIWMLLGSPAVICSMLSPRAKRIGDIFAGTIVISERGPKLGPPPMMPPQLAWWASSLQLSGLSAEQADIARQFLSRAMQLDPQVRDQMAYRIATDVLSRVAESVPILLVEQNLALVRRVGGDAVVVAAGAVAHRGPVRELLADEELTRSLLGVGHHHRRAVA